MTCEQLTLLLVAGLVLAVTGCKHDQLWATGSNHNPTGPHTIGKLESHDPRFDQLVAPDAKIEKLGQGFAWSEGPIWIKDGAYLLFSDVISNTVFKWKEGEGVTEFLKPSGYTGSIPRGGEPGSN